MELLDEVLNKVGFYIGQGVNHEGDHFVGKLEIKSILSGKAVEISFNASSTDGFVFHDEVSLFTKNEKDEWCLFNLNSNTDKCLVHNLESSDFVDNKRTLSFIYGNYDNREAFRERVCLDLFLDNKIGYHYYWGVPGGEFQYRSGLIMQDVKST
ncbi:MAG: hypothetical protein COB02_17795 [Candidatus Cloacimonadota bacterium]|nr:MAG: hypothetical protein COB02_17795 [Candidatus Cloacimonadota bacterium]